MNSSWVTNFLVKNLIITTSEGGEGEDYVDWRWVNYDYYACFWFLQLLCVFCIKKRNVVLHQIGSKIKSTSQILFSSCFLSGLRQGSFRESRWGRDLPLRQDGVTKGFMFPWGKVGECCEQADSPDGAAAAELIRGQTSSCGGLGVGRRLEGSWTRTLMMGWTIGVSSWSLSRQKSVC